MIPLFLPGHGDGHSEAAPLVVLSTNLRTNARAYRRRGLNEAAGATEWAWARLREAMRRNA